MIWFPKLIHSNLKYIKYISKFLIAWFNLSALSAQSNQSFINLASISFGVAIFAWQCFTQVTISTNFYILMQV